MKTFMQRKEDVNRKWYVVDATDLVLGRMSTVVANILRGKDKPTYTPHIDCGDYVIIVNAEKVRLTGNKMKNKMYYNHARKPGSLRQRTAKEMIESYPVEMIERSIKGMLPNGRLGRQVYKKLFVYAGSEHSHSAQNPEELIIKEAK